MVLTSVRSVPALLGQNSGNFLIPFLRGEHLFGAEFLTYSERAHPVLLYGFDLSSLGSSPARPELWEFFNSIFPGGTFRLGPNF